MAEAMPARLLTEWLAYGQLEPFGAGTDENRYRADVYHQYATNGLLLANLVNLWTGRSAKKYRPGDFIPDAVKLEPTLSAEPEEPAVLYQKLKSAFGLMTRKQ